MRNFLKVFLAAFACWLAAGTVHAAPDALNLTQLGALESYLSCREKCEHGMEATRVQCLTGCGSEDALWEKNEDDVLDVIDYDIALLQYWDADDVCVVGDVVKPAEACGKDKCLELDPTRTEADCEDLDGDGLRAWAETAYGTLDSVAQVQCSSGADCGTVDTEGNSDAFQQECRWVPEADRELCVPRKCEGKCTAFHLETVVQDNNEVIVHVHFDYAPEPPTVLDLYVEYDRNAMKLVDARPLPLLEDRNKELQVRHNSDGHLRLVVLGGASTLPIVPGAIIELVFFRTSAQQASIKFVSTDEAQMWSMAPDPGAFRKELADDSLWGSELNIAAADPTGNRLVLHYSFDNPRSPRDISSVRSADTICGLIASCSMLDVTTPLDKEKAERYKAQYSALQQGTTQFTDQLDGVSGKAAFFDGRTDHMELPLTFEDPEVRTVDAEDIPQNLVVEPIEIQKWSKIYAGDVVPSEDEPLPAEFELAPDGSRSARKIVDASDTKWGARQTKPQGLTAGEPHTLSVFLRKPTDAEALLPDEQATQTPELYFLSTRFRVQLDLKNGKAKSRSLSNSTALPSNVSFIDHGAWWRVSVTYLPKTTSEIVRLYAAMSPSGAWWPRKVTQKGQVVTWGLQLEAGKFATPFRRPTSKKSQGDQSFSVSTWLFLDGEADASGPEGSEHGRVIFSHAEQASENTRFGLLAQEADSGTEDAKFDLVWFEGNLHESEITTKVIAEDVPQRVWTHVGMTVDAVKGLVWFYVDGEPAPADTNAKGIPVAFGMMPTLWCPQLEQGSGTGILLSQQGSASFGQDSERILVASSQSNLFGIESMDQNGLGRHDVVRTGVSSAQDPDYSPLVDKIVYSSSEGGNYEIWIANGDGTEPQQISTGFGDTARGIFARRPRWAPNASGIIFESNVYSLNYQHNTLDQVYSLYYIAFDSSTGQVAVPAGSGVVNELNYGDMVSVPLGPRRLVDSFRASNGRKHLFAAKWLRSSEFSEEGYQFTGELLATTADSSYEKRELARVRLRSDGVLVVTPYSIAGVGAEESVELLAAHFAVPRGGESKQTLFLSREKESFDTHDQFTATFDSTSYELVVTHTPASYDPTCADRNRDQQDSPAEDRNGDGAFDEGDCYPVEASFYIQPDPSIEAILEPVFEVDPVTQVSVATGELGVKAPVGQWFTDNGKTVRISDLQTKRHGALVKIDIMSYTNNLPIAADAEVARISFQPKAGTTQNREATAVKRVIHQDLYVQNSSVTRTPEVGVELLAFPKAIAAEFDTTHGGSFSRASELPEGESLDATYETWSEVVPRTQTGDTEWEDAVWQPAIYRVAPNTPRWERRAEAETPMLLIEGARTNEILNGADMSAFGWSSAGGTGTTAGAGAAPDGTESGNGISLATGEASFSTLFPSTDGVVSFWTASGTGAGTLATGSVDHTFPLSSVWARHAALATAGDSLRFVGGAAAYDTLVWGMQAEEGASFASSYIPTDGETRSRAADVLTYSSVPAIMVDGRWSIEVRPLFASGELAAQSAAVPDEPTLVSFGEDLSGIGQPAFYDGKRDRIYFLRDDRSGTDATYLAVVQGGEEKAAAGPLEFSANQRIRLIFDSKAGEVQVLGVTLGADTYIAGSWAMPTTNLRVGGVYDGTDELFGRVSVPMSAPAPTDETTNSDVTLDLFDDQHFEQVTEATFSPDGTRLLLAGIQHARPFVGRTTDLLGTHGLELLSESPERVSGLDWTGLERLFPCNWVAGMRNSASGLYDGAFRGGLDELKLHNYVRPALAYASEHALGEQWLEKGGMTGDLGARVETCVRDSDCPDYKLCDAGTCEVQTCDPTEDYPCDRGQCRLMPLPVDLHDAATNGDADELNAHWVCSVECDVDAQCFQGECQNGPCRFCSDSTDTCIECQEAVKDYGSFKVSYIEGCPDRNGFSCEEGTCQTECYTFENGQSIYLCDPALEYCRQGKCAAHEWGWNDLAPASFAGLGQATYDRRPAIKETIAVSQLHEIKVEAFGVADFLHAPEVIVEGQVTKSGAGIFDLQWVELGRLNVNNKTATDAVQNPYRLVTYHPAQKLRFRLITPPYENLTNSATGLMARDADFCRGTPAYCDNRANGSRANIGYRIGISEYEARVDCQARLGGTANCGNTNPDLQHYLYGGQPAVVITNVEVNGQRELGLPNNRNQICGYWHRTTGNGTSPTVQGDGFAPLPTVFGPAESSNYGTYLGSAPLGLTAPTALVDFNAVTGGAYALLNCNYAPVGSSDIAALVIDGIPDIDYTTSFTGQGPHGPVTETANGCFVEIDDVRSEPCYEMIGNEASIDILSPAPTGSADNGTLTYDLFRSFGYDPTPVYLSE